MRWPWVLGGIGLLLVAAGGCVAFRGALFDPESRRLPHEQLKMGMTLREVASVLGGTGDPQPVYISGSMSYWEKHEYFKHRWEDPYTTVDVIFQGPKGAAGVIHIEPQEKPAPDLAMIWTPRIIFLLAAATGLGLLIFGFRRTAAGTNLRTGGV